MVQDGARPNCNVDDGYLSEKILMCAGEDPSELFHIVQDLTNQCPVGSHYFRCYQFWKFSTFTLVWTGIGTGCVEPLLHEILATTDVVKEIVLIGTAGRIARRESQDAQSYTDTDQLDDNKAYIIAPAYLGPSAFRALDIRGPLTPSLYPEGPNKSIVSTDLYYHDDFQLPDGVSCDLVDMEVGQFYL